MEQYQPCVPEGRDFNNIKLTYNNACPNCIITYGIKSVKSNGKPVAKSEIRRLSKSLEIKNDILLHRSTKVEGSRYE